MSIIIAHASIDENNRISGGKAGDQTGRELCTREYYLHKKGWRVFRAKDPNKREKIAEGCMFAVKNDNIGYDQSQRDTLWNNSKGVNFDPSKVKVKCETDCSALIRVCCAYAGILLQNFNTSNEANVLLASGEFVEVTSQIDLRTGKGLLRGDVLVTRTKGHTVVVESVDIPKDPDTYQVKGVTVKTLTKGTKGDFVKILQRSLVSKGFLLGNIDGDFGDRTLEAVKEFQSKNKLKVDGIVGKNTWSLLL